MRERIPAIPLKPIQRATALLVVIFIFENIYMGTGWPLWVFWTAAAIAAAAVVFIYRSCRCPRCGSHKPFQKVGVSAKEFNCPACGEKIQFL